MFLQDRSRTYLPAAVSYLKSVCPSIVNFRTHTTEPSRPSRHGRRADSLESLQNFRVDRYARTQINYRAR